MSAVLEVEPQTVVICHMGAGNLGPMHVSVLPAYMHVHPCVCVCLLPVETRRWCQFPGTGITDGWCFCFLGTEPGFSARSTIALYQ